MVFFCLIEGGYELLFTESGFYTLFFTTKINSLLTSFHQPSGQLDHTSGQRGRSDITQKQQTCCFRVEECVVHSQEGVPDMNYFYVSSNPPLPFDNY